MRKTTEDAPRLIRWNISSTLEDLDFADDLALLSHTHHHLQEKTNALATSCTKDQSDKTRSYDFKHHQSNTNTSLWK